MDERTVLTLGVWGGVSAADVPDLAAHAVEYGCVQAWREDPNAAGALFGLSAATGTRTELRFGAGILPLLGRALTAIRTEATTLHILSDGRSVLGLWPSSDTTVTSCRREQCVKPVTRLRGYFGVLRRALAGVWGVYEGETNHLDGFRVGLDVPDPPAVHVAGLGRRTRASASEICDGAIVAFMTAEAVGNAVIEVCSFACVTSFSHLGFGKAVDQFCHRWQAGDRAEAAAGLCERRERMRATVAALTLAT